MAEGFRAIVSGESVANGTDVSVVIPATVQANDGLIAVWTAAGTGSTVTTPSGWTLVGAGPIDKSTVLRTYVFKKYASAGDAGATLTITKSAADATKRQLTVAAYSGVDQTDFIQDFASFVETTAGLTHSIPSVTASGSGNWRAAFIVDRGSPGSSDFTPPASLPSERSMFVGSGTGTCSTDWADSGASVTAGTYSGDSWTAADDSTANAITLAFIIKAAGASSVTVSGPTPISGSITFHTPNITVGANVTVAPDRMVLPGLAFFPLTGSATATVTPDPIVGGVTFLDPTEENHQSQSFIPDPVFFEIEFFPPTIVIEGGVQEPPPDENPPPSGTRKFVGPTRIEMWPISPDARIAVKVTVNQTLYRKSGVWLVGENLNFADLEGVDRLYQGGATPPLSDAQLDELVAAGLGQYVVDASDPFPATFTETF